MKILLFSIFCVFFTTSLFAQSASEYYFEGKDTLFYSPALQENRKITVSLPKTYTPEKATQFPVIFVFDRQNNRIFRQIYETINYLVYFDEVPESIIIGISSDNHSKRYLETSLKDSAENAKGEPMERFLFEELIPWTEKTYHAGKIRTLIGHSRFGYFTSYLLIKRMNELTSVIAISPFYVQKNVNLVDSLQRELSHTQLTHTVYYRFITGDPFTDSKDYDLMHDFLKQSVAIDSKLNWKGYRFNSVQHMAVPGMAVPPALIDVFDYWSEEVTKIQRSDVPLTEVAYSEFKLKMKQHYGSEIGIGLAVLNGIAYQYYNDGKFKEAINVWNILLKEYPMFTYAYISIANACLQLKDSEESMRSLEKAQLGLTSNTFYSDEEKQSIIEEITQLKRR